MIFHREITQHVFFHPDEITHHIRWPHFKAWNVAIVRYRGNFFRFGDVQPGKNELVFNCLCGRLVSGIDQGYLKHVMAVQDFRCHPQGFRHKSDRSNAAALAVTAIVHLFGRLENMLAAHGDGAGKTRDPAAPFFFHFDAGKRGIFPDQPLPGSQYPFSSGKYFAGCTH